MHRRPSDKEALSIHKYAADRGLTTAEVSIRKNNFIKTSSAHPCFEKVRSPGETLRNF